MRRLHEEGEEEGEEEGGSNCSVVQDCIKIVLTEVIFILGSIVFCKLVVKINQYSIEFERLGAFPIFSEISCEPSHGKGSWLVFITLIPTLLNSSTYGQKCVPGLIFYH